VAIFFTLIGIVLILAVLRDVFRTLFPYAEKNTTSKVIAKVLWRGFHRDLPFLARALTIRARKPDESEDQNPAICGAFFGALGRTRTCDLLCS
jgi:hypothetical protein